MFYKETPLKTFPIFTGYHLSRSLFIKKLLVIKLATLLKETLAKVFLCEYCKFFKNTNLEENQRMAASATQKSNTSEKKQLVENLLEI